MIHFPVLRTHRLTIQLKELSIGDSLAIAAMPTHLEQAGISMFLKASVMDAKGVGNPNFWTIPERNLAVCHYLSCSLDDGPDFSVGRGHYMDYLDFSRDIEPNPQPIPLDTLGGDEWAMRHLTGWAAESIERLEGELPVSGRLHWLVGAMAAQLIRKDEGAQEDFQDEWLLDRARVLLAYPEQDFICILALFQRGREALWHLFDYDFFDRGSQKDAGRRGCILFNPIMEVGDLPPARFPVRTGLSAFARGMGQKLG
jgi:hypothetical protein